MKKLLALGLGLGILGGVYLHWLRPYQLNWGATPEESARPLPGDDYTTDPIFKATRAVTVQASPADIWPWLMQIGYQRAGFYSYDWFDNKGVPSATTILSEYQDLQVGDHVPLSAYTYEIVADLEPERYMLWHGEDPTKGTWLFYLDPVDENTTRLITRLRGTWNWTSPFIIIDLGVEFFDIFFMRKCMLGIKERAEGLAAEQAAVPG